MDAGRGRRAKRRQYEDTASSGLCAIPPARSLKAPIFVANTRDRRKARRARAGEPALGGAWPRSIAASRERGSIDPAAGRQDVGGVFVEGFAADEIPIARVELNGGVHQALAVGVVEGER